MFAGVREEAVVAVVAVVDIVDGFGGFRTVFLFRFYIERVSMMGASNRISRIGFRAHYFSTGDVESDRMCKWSAGSFGICSSNCLLLVDPEG